MVLPEGHSPQTHCLHSAVKSWAKGKRVCSRVWSRMAAVIVKIPGAVTAAWPVCVCHCECIHLLWSLFVNVLCKWMEVIIVSCQCGLSSICLWIASLDGLLAALCCVVSASVTKDKPTCFRYCHTSSTVIQHEILSLPSKFQQISYFWVEFEKFCILSSEVFELLNQIALASLSSPSITSVKHLGNHRKCTVISVTTWFHFISFSVFFF